MNRLVLPFRTYIHIPTCLHTRIHTYIQFNRADEVPSQAAMKAQFAEAGRSGWTFIDLLSDFHLLLFLTDFLDMSEVSVICQSVVDRSIPLGEGHVDLLRAIAGE